MTRLARITEGLWAAGDMLRFPGGVRMPIRMTVVRLADGSLLLLSPVKLDAPLVSELRRLGEVSLIVAPNLLHHLFAAEALAHFPDARLLAATGLGVKRPDLRIDGTLDEAPHPALMDDFDQVFVRGAPRTNETVLFHRASRSLLVTDFLFHLPRAENFPTALLFSLMGVRGRVAQSRVWRVLVNDRAKAADSARRVLAWDVHRLVPAHGEVLAGAREDVARALVWMSSGPLLLPAPRPSPQ